MATSTKVSLTQRACDDIFEDVIQRFEENSTYVSSKFVGRQEVIELIYISFLLGRHVMLEGPPGVAKSQLVRAIFDTVNDASSFYTMMMPNTAPENLFGPINMKAFRERSEIRYNTKNMLPEANFAFIDEVYRGPDSVLGSMLNILNERIFTNGPLVVDCPLVTAVGTTNFQSDSHLVEAFKDRWLFHYVVQPLSDKQERLSLIHMADHGEPSIDKPSPLDFATVRKFAAHLKHVHLTEEQHELYDELVSEFSSKCTKELGTAGRSSCLGACSKRITDRRLVDGVRVLKLGKLLDEFGSSSEEDSEVSMFAVLKFVLCKGTKPQFDIFADVCSRIVGGSAIRSAERKKLKTYVSIVDQLVSSYDVSMSATKKASILAKVRAVLNPSDHPDDADLQFSDTELMAVYDKNRAKLKELELELVADQAGNAKLYQDLP